MRKLLILFAALFSTAAFGAIAVDQTGSGDLSGTGTSVVVTPGATVSNGSIVYIYLTWCSAVGSTGAPSGYSPASGFSQIGSTLSNVNDFCETTLWRKTAGGSEPSSYTMSWTESTASDTYGACAALLALSGVDSTTPNGTLVSARDSSANTTVDIPALTTNNDNSWDVAFVANNGNVQTFTVSSWGSSLIERVDNNTGDYCHGAIASALRATAGTQAATSVTGSNSGTSHAFRLEVNEAAASSSAAVKRRRR